MSQSILPGATLGVLGSGQLGRMFAIAARQMGYGVHVYSPEADSPTGHVADREFVASYEDDEQLREFAKSVDVVTFEFENIPASTSSIMEEIVPVRPSGHVLHVAQNRLREKSTLSGFGLPVTPFEAVSDIDSLMVGIEKLGCPCVLKSAAFGYDGKGQQIIRERDEAESAWKAIGRCEAILEAFIDYDCEISVVGVRNANGDWTHLGPFENDHANHILDVTCYPAQVSDTIKSQAVDVARELMKALDAVGVLCVEFFVSPSKGLLINEIAPRPHNSGHLSIEAFSSSQFEQQVRSICNLPLGQTKQPRPSAMVNLLGEVWENGTPDWKRVLTLPDVSLHLYGKKEPRVGRKMGHITATADSVETARQLALSAREALLTSESDQGDN